MSTSPVARVGIVDRGAARRSGRRPRRLGAGTAGDGAGRDPSAVVPSSQLTRQASHILRFTGGTTMASTPTTEDADQDRWIPTWDGASYAANTGHHREHDAWFLERFPIRPTDRLLDLG